MRLGNRPMPPTLDRRPLTICATPAGHRSSPGYSERAPGLSRSAGRHGGMAEIPGLARIDRLAAASADRKPARTRDASWARNRRWPGRSGVVHRVAGFRSPVLEAVPVPAGLWDEQPLAAGLGALSSLGQLHRRRPLQGGENSRAGWRAVASAKNGMKRGGPEGFRRVRRGISRVHQSRRPEP